MSEVARIDLALSSHNPERSRGWGTDPSFQATEAFDRVHRTEVVLDDGNPKTVSFGDLETASLVIIEAIGGKVRARLTSADGDDSPIPVDPVIWILSRSVPYTALDLTRAAGLTSDVRVLITLGAPPT